MRTSWLLAACAAFGLIACHPSVAPQDASAPPSSSSASAESAVPSHASASPEPAATSSAEQAAAADQEREASTARPSPSSAEGDVQLPPSQAQPWDTSQSDGKPSHKDRGVKDYARIILRHRDMFRNCYEKSLASHPGIRGRVLLRFKLDPKGKVVEASVDPSGSDILDKDLEACMVAAVKSLDFPRSTRGMESIVRYPFQFNPHSSRRRR